MTNKATLITTPNHPYLRQAVDKGFRTISYDDFIESLENDSVDKSLQYLDATILASVEKEYFFTLVLERKLQFIPDLSTVWSEKWVRHFKTAVSLIPKHATGKFEAYGDDLAWAEILNLTPVQIKNPGIGFHIPRTLAMIINEAYFSIEDGLCSKKDLDRAMKYGVNYPMGPFEWISETGPAWVLYLLDELYDVTRDPRYRAAKTLRLEVEGKNL